MRVSAVDAPADLACMSYRRTTLLHTGALALILVFATVPALGSRSDRHASALPTNTLPPTVIGSAMVGGTLQASPGSWTGSPPPSLAYQWSRCDLDGRSCATLGDSTGVKYSPGGADIGARLVVGVIASNRRGSTFATSSATDIVAPRPTTTPPPPPTTTTTPPPPPTTTTTPAPPPPTTTTTPAPPPPPGGSLLNRVDYTTPSPFGWSWQIQAGNYGRTDSYHTGSIFESVADPNGATRNVAHIHLPASTTGRAAEGVYRRPIDLGVTDYYALSLRVPVGWHTIAQNSSWHTIAAQLNYGGLGGPPVSLVVQPDDLELMMLSGHVSADSSGNATGYEFQASPNYNSQTGTRLYLDRNLTAQEGQWIDVVIEVKWATTWNGFVNAWLRTPGGSWSQVVDTQQTYGKLVPTQQWGTNVEGNTVDVNGIDASTGKEFLSSDKAGLYAGPGPTPMDIWESAFLRGTSFDAVASRLP
jgi:hypothetical protein